MFSKPPFSAPVKITNLFHMIKKLFVSIRRTADPILYKLRITLYLSITPAFLDLLSDLSSYH